ncbi:MAG: hypothetical protein FJ293_02760 [Planctomycetes bacterium]|nr:hypothetical protein [Planctomycetota bacterium]
MALEHRLLIYVFRQRVGGLEYLVERRWPAQEYSWSPIPAEVGYCESIESATRRSMADPWHAPPPERLVDLRVCGHLTVGDLDLIDWGIGYRVRSSWEPRAAELGVRAELVWQPLPIVMGLLEDEAARRALFRLHVAAAE